MSYEGDASGDILLVGWGCTYGPIREAITRLRATGTQAAHLHLRHLHPLAPGLTETFARYRHILVVDTTNNHLYELYNVWYNGAQWEAGSGAFFDMNTNDRRPEGWTSADAAGLAILPGLVRYDEVHDPGEIRHAFRVTVRATNGKAMM